MIELLFGRFFFDDLFFSFGSELLGLSGDFLVFDDFGVGFDLLEFSTMHC